MALVILAGSVAVLIFQWVHQNEMNNEQKPADDKAGIELIEDWDRRQLGAWLRFRFSLQILELEGPRIVC
jgi:hypothetical protein